MMRSRCVPDRSGADFEPLGHVGRLQPGGEQLQDLCLPLRELDLGLDGDIGPAQEGAHAGQELVGRERLDQ
jgi:hypothetical protein